MRSQIQRFAARTGLLLGQAFAFDAGARIFVCITLSVTDAIYTYSPIAATSRPSPSRNYWVANANVRIVDIENHFETHAGALILVPFLVLLLLV